MRNHACRMHRSVRTRLLRGRTATGRPGRPRPSRSRPICPEGASLRTYDLPRDGRAGLAPPTRGCPGGRHAAEISQAALESFERGRGRWVAALRHRSMMAWSEGPRARRCRVLRIAGGKDWPSACARRRAAARTGPVPRRQSADAMRRTGLACRSPTGLLRPAGHLQPRIRGGVCPRPLRGTRPWPCRAGTRSAGGPASLGPSRQSAWLLCGRIAELAARPFQILIRRHVLFAEFPRAQLAQRLG